MVHEQTVSQAGEDAVLVAIREVIDGHNAARAGLRLGPGDDAAVVAFNGPEVVITSDTMAEGQDFRRQWWQGAATGGTTPFGSPEEWPLDVGTKAAAQNLSDLNAMGAQATALLVSLTLPPDTSIRWVQDFYRGMLRACAQPGAEQCLVVGGDLASGQSLSVTITALGSAPEGGSLLRRDTAQPADVVAVAGPLGYAAAGLALLENPREVTLDVSALDQRQGYADTLQRCRHAQTRPNPPLTAGSAALAGGATAGMDISDGLLRDATRLAQASGVNIQLDDEVLAAEASQLQLPAAVLGAGDAAALEWVLIGGEDYSLLATFPAGGRLPDGFRRIGQVLDNRPVENGPVVLTEHRITGEGWDSVRR